MADNSDIIIRRMTVDDIPQVVEIEEKTFAMPWSDASFRSELTRNVAARYLVAVKNDRVIGYAGTWIILDESHVTNIAIAEQERGHGYGRQLTTALLQYVANLGGAYVTLEVRKSNIRAQNLYKSLGFMNVGVRKKYYEDNGEDALLMVCDRLPEADPDFEEPETIRE